MNRDFDHLLAEHLLTRERATRGYEEVERDTAACAKRAARSGGDGIARGGRGTPGARMFRALFR